MQVQALEVPKTSTADQTLHEKLSSMTGPLFAVIDGALFDDLPGQLESAGILCRSLFLGQTSTEMAQAGPWLVPLNDTRTRAHMEELANQQPCTVFWSCQRGEMALWKHLRTINEILVPDDRAAQPATPDQPIKYERVLFRHWDPNVLGSILPVLSAPQFACFFGPAEAVLMNAIDYGGIKLALHTDDLPPASKSPLRITPEQIEALKGVMMQYSRKRIRSYLGNVARREVEVLGQGRVDEIIRDSEWTGTELLGLKTEQAHGRWAYIMVRTNGRALEQPGLREWITDGAGLPDAKIKVFLQSMGEAEKQGGSKAWL